MSHEWLHRSRYDVFGSSCLAGRLTRSLVRFNHKKRRMLQTAVPQRCFTLHTHTHTLANFSALCPNVNKHKAKMTGKLVSHPSDQTSCVINLFRLSGLRQMVPFRRRSPLPPPFFTLRGFHHEKCILTTSSRAKLQRGLC